MLTMDIASDWLVSDDLLRVRVVRVNPNSSAPSTFAPDGAVIHYTGGSTLHGAINTLTSNTATKRVSAHVAIDRNGDVAQLVRFNRRAWHAGSSRKGDRLECNGFSFGIELVYPGPVSELEAPRWQAHFINDQWWPQYPQEQMGRLVSVINLLRKHYGITWLAGHCDVSPGRKVDPGPRFPWAEITEKTGLERWTP